MLDERTEEQTLEAAQRFYDERLKALEPTHKDVYAVALLGTDQFSLGRSMEEAFSNMRRTAPDADPNNLFCFRIGRIAAIEFGPR